MTIQIEKFSAFNKERKTSLATIGSSVSIINKELSKVLKQQAYMHKNPDNNGANDLIPLVSDKIDVIAQAFAEINAQVVDFMAVKTGTMTIDELLTKYPVINLEEYSKELL